MSTYVDRLRQQWTTLQDPSITDEDILQLLPRIEPETFGNLSQDEIRNVALKDQNAFTRGFGAGIDQMQGIGGGLLGAIGHATGSDTLRDAGMEIYNRNMQETALYGRPEALEIDDVSSALEWAGYTLGNRAPMMAMTLIGGGLGGLVARKGAQAMAAKLMTDMTAKGVARDVAAKEAGKAIAKRIATGQSMGAFAASTGMGVGEIYGDTEDLGVTLTHGAIVGALDASPIAGVLNRLGLSKAAKEAVKRSVPGEIFKQAGKEGVTESLQSLVEQHAKYWVETEGQSLLGNTGAIDWKEVFESAAAGALGGGVMGGGFQAISGSPTQADIDTRIENVGAEVLRRGGDALEAELAKAEAAAQESARKVAEEGEKRRLQALQTPFDADQFEPIQVGKPRVPDPGIFDPEVTAPDRTYTAADLGIGFDRAQPVAPVAPITATDLGIAFEPTAQPKAPALAIGGVEQAFDQLDGAPTGKAQVAPRPEMTQIEDAVAEAEAFGQAERAVRLRNLGGLYQRSARLAEEGQAEAAARMRTRANQLHEQLIGPPPVTPPTPTIAGALPAPAREGTVEGGPVATTQPQQANRGETIEGERPPAELPDGRPRALPAPREPERLTTDGVIYGEAPAGQAAARATTQRAFEGEQPLGTDWRPAADANAEAAAMRRGQAQDANLERVPGKDQYPGMAPSDPDPALVPQVQAQGLPESFAAPSVRASVKQLATQLAENGGMVTLLDDMQRVTGRTSSVNPDWFQNSQEDLGSVGYIKATVTKALKGDKLGPKQQRVMRVLIDEAQAQALDTDTQEAYQAEEDYGPAREQAMAMGVAQEGGEYALLGEYTSVPVNADDPLTSARELFNALRSRQKPVVRDGLGEIEFTGKSWNKFKGGVKSNSRKVQLLQAVPAIIEKGRYSGREPVSGRDDQIVAFHYFDGHILLDGERHHVGVTVGEDANRNLFYNANYDADKLWAKKKAARDPQVIARGVPPSRVDDQGTDYQSVDEHAEGVNLTVFPLAQPRSRYDDRTDDMFADQPSATRPVADRQAPRGELQNDMFGANPERQAVADEARRRDQRRSPGTDVPAGIDGGLFSDAQRQADMADVPQDAAQVLNPLRSADIDWVRTGTPSTGVTINARVTVDGGQSTYAYIEDKGKEYGSTRYEVDGETFGSLRDAKARAVEVVNRRLAEDGYLQSAETTGNTVQDGGRDTTLNVEQAQRRYDDRTQDLFAELDQIEAQDPYDGTSTRGDTTSEQKAVGRDAVASVLRLLRRAARLAGQSDSIPAGDSGVHLLGLRIARRFSEGRPAQLVGEQVTSPADLAVLAQVYRDPRFETFRVLLLDDDKRVIGERTITSRLPASVNFGMAGSALVREAVEGSGASSYYIMHNHPSGRALPSGVNSSSGDIPATVEIANNVPGFAGHVIVDHNEYSVIQADGSYEVIDAPELNGVNFWADPAVPNQYLGREIQGVITAAEVAKGVAQNEQAVIISTAGGMRQEVVAISSVPMSVIDAAATGGPEVREQLVKALLAMNRTVGGGGGTFVVLPFEGAQSLESYPALLKGFALDVFDANGRSIRGDTSAGSHIRPQTNVTGEVRTYISDTDRRERKVSERGIGRGVTEQEAEYQRLSALHNMSVENLLHAADLGGIAAPSVAVVKDGMAVDGFGEVTLIGTRDLVDPKRVPVYDADAYTARWPRAEYPKAKTKAAQALVDQLRPWAQKYSDRRIIIDNTFDAANGTQPGEIIQYWMRDESIRAWFVSETQGVNVRVPMMPETLRHELSADPAVRAAVKRLGGAQTLRALGNNSDEAMAARREIGSVVRDAIQRKYGEREDLPADARADLVESMTARFIDEDGSLRFGPYDQIISDQFRIGKKVIDSMKLDKTLARRIKGKEAAFKAWVEAKVMGMFDQAPVITVGRRKVPYNLENIVRAMTTGATAGVEQGMTFSAGKARAVAATRFKDVEHMRGAASTSMKSEAEVKAAREATDKLLEEYRTALLPHYKYSDTWSAMDDSMEALAKYAKSRLSRDPKIVMRQALKSMEFENVPDDVIDLALRAAQAMLEAPVPYFEAKPQRAVGFDEFAGAVVPKGMDPKARKVLEDAGVTLAEYSGEENRAAAVDELRRKLAQRGGDVLFSKAEAENYVAALNRMLDSDPGHRELAKLGATPKVLQMLGARPLPMTLSKRVARKAVGVAGHKRHKVDRAVLEGLPELIGDPVAVFRGPQPDTLMVITDASDANGDPVGVGVLLEMRAGGLFVNDIRSVHGKQDSENQFDKWVREGKLLYVNKKKSSGRSSEGGVDFPATNDQIQSLSYKVATEDDLVNFSRNESPANTHTPGSLRAAMNEAFRGVAAALERGGRLRVISNADIPANLQALHSISAWHGSPHRFDKFSMENIGSGEGAQAYGHGLYFADSEGVARGYRDRLAQTIRAHFASSDGARLNDKALDAMQSNAPAGVRELLASSRVRATIKNGSKTKFEALVTESAEHHRNLSESYRRRSESYRESPPVASTYSADQLQEMSESHRRMADEIEAFFNSLQFNEEVKGGALYKVNIDVDPDTLLDWDKPLSEQSEMVRDAVHRVARSVEPYGLDRITDDMRGVEMSRMLNSPEGVAALRQAGIKGIRYLDGMSRGDGEGSYNYVIFDEDLISIQDIQYSKNGDIQAYVKDGVVHMVADNIDRSVSVKGLMMHEIGVHLRRLGKDDAEFQSILEQMGRLRDMGSKAAKEAFARVPADTPAHLVTEEAMGYLAETAPDLSVSQRFMAWMKAKLREWLRAIPGMDRARAMQWANNLTEIDLVWMAQAATRQAGAAAVAARQSADMAASISIDDGPESPAWKAAAAKGLDMSHKARMERALDMGYVTDIDAITEPVSARDNPGAGDRTAEAVRATGGRDGRGQVSGGTGRGARGGDAGGVGAGNVVSPQTFYHGTAEDIYGFQLEHPTQKDHGWLGTGIYLTTAPRIAESYSRLKAGSIDPTVMPVHIRGSRFYEATLADKQKLQNASRAESRAFTEKLQSEGYDGVVLKIADGLREVVVFDPANIRSTSAAFDPDSTESADLLASRRTNQTRTPEFREWFGDSKVVDENGEPLVVYHGTGADVSRFEEGRQAGGQLGKGFYFSPRPEASNLFAEIRRRRDPDSRPNVMPVYLSLKNPYIVEGRSNIPLNGFNAEVLKNLGHDGVMLLDQGGNIEELTVFSPEQIKSATGNRGTYDSNNPDIRFSRRRVETPNVTAEYDSGSPVPDDQVGFDDEWSRTDQLKSLFIDRFHALNKVQKTKADQTADPMTAITLFPGATRAQLDDFEQSTAQPLAQAIQDTGLSFERVAEWLHARHAREANAVLRERNPDRQDNEALSGMTDAEADRILRAYGNHQRLQRVGQMVDEMTSAHLDQLVRDDLMTQAEADGLRSLYQHYVPLQREDTLEGGGIGRGRGFDIRGKETKLRAGSTRKVDHANMIAQLVAQSQGGIVRGQKNRVSQRLYEFAQANPDPDLWSITDLPQDPYLAADGTIRRRSNVMDSQVLAVKYGGEQKYLWFNPDSQHGRKIAAAMKNLNGGSQNKLTSALLTVNRYLSSINTSLSPEFVISNFFRDIQTAGFNLTDTEVKNMELATIKRTPKALRAIHSVLRGDGSAEYAAEFEEFRKAGGMTGWTQHYETIESHMAAIQRGLDWQTKPGLKQIRKVFKFIEDYNQVVENGIRLSTYISGREAGLSKEKAARIAKEVTVDFNRRGEWGTAMNAMYLFYNASVQGSARMIRALADPRNKRLQKMVGTVIAGSVVLDMVNRALSDDEDDEYGLSGYDQIPDHIRDRNLILWDFMGVTESGYFKVPLPWGYNIFAIAGQEVGKAADAAAGRYQGYSAPKSAARLLGGTLDAFNPVSDGSLLQTISPTVVDPFTKIAENKDWHGGKLYPDYNQSAPDYTKAFANVRPGSKQVAEWLGELTRSDKTLKSAVDISPETIDMWIDTVTGSVGRVVADTIEGGVALATGKPRELNEIPMLRKVVGEVGESAQKATFYDAFYGIEDIRTELSRIKREDPKAYASTLAGIGPRRQLLEYTKQTKSRMNQLKKIKREAERRGNDEVADRYEQRILELMKQYTTRYNRVMYGQKAEAA